MNAPDGALLSNQGIERGETSEPLRAGGVAEVQNDVMGGIGKQNNAVRRGPDVRDLAGDVAKPPVNRGQPGKRLVDRVGVAGDGGHQRVRARGVNVGAAPDRGLASTGP